MAWVALKPIPSCHACLQYTVMAQVPTVTPTSPAEASPICYDVPTRPKATQQRECPNSASKRGVLNMVAKNAASEKTSLTTNAIQTKEQQKVPRAS
eukprot:1396314-Amphidinium_carterae.1